MATPRSTRHSSASTSSASRAAPSRSAKKKHRYKAGPKRSSDSAKHTESLAVIAERIARIKSKLINAAPSHEIIDDFFEGITKERAFTIEFHDGTKWLQDAIARSCEDILGEPKGEAVVNLMAVPEHKLIHGSMLVDGYMGVAVYFEDLRLGVMGLYPSYHTGSAYFARLVCVDSPQDPRYAPN